MRHEYYNTVLDVYNKHIRVANLVPLVLFCMIYMYTYRRMVHLYEALSVLKVNLQLVLSKHIYTKIMICVIQTLHLFHFGQFSWSSGLFIE